jgi:magnesium chelatase subunit D
MALAVLAVDPLGLGGMWLRARSGPVRDRFLERLAAIPLPKRRVHATIADSQLFGGVDLTATLSTGRLVTDSGILSSPAALILAMAERCPKGLSARLGQALDSRQGCVIALDEGADEDEMPPDGLAERLGLFVTLGDIPARAASEEPAWTEAAIEAARGRLETVSVPGESAERMVRLAAGLGIDSLRAPLLSLRAARALAALHGRTQVSDEDVLAAAELVFAHRATALEPPQPQDAHDTPEPPGSDQTDAGDSDTDNAVSPPEDVVLDAVRAALPPDLLEQLVAHRALSRGGTGGGSGQRRKGNRRGRPLPSRPGHPDGRSRIDIVATLRAAAPWQPVRRAVSPRGHLLHIRPADIRLKRFEDRSDRLLIFAVDASGSAAMTRLAEAKGAVELLLAEAYARRDHVALVAFRGSNAEMLLPPTRSLVQTKRRLTALPGGGGTPLAAGLQAAEQAAHHARRHGLTPSIVLLTDGRGNIALDGTANRALAASDTEAAARRIGALGVPSLVIDTSNRPQAALQELSNTLRGTYVPLPRASAERLSDAVSAALEG